MRKSANLVKKVHTLRSPSVPGMNAHVHVALLVCGKLAGPALDVLGDYNDVYFKFLHDTKPDTVLFTMDAFDVVHRMEYPDETKYDAIVLTGSAASAYEDVEWVNKLVAYIARVADIKPTVKLIGALLQLCTANSITDDQHHQASALDIR